MKHCEYEGEKREAITPLGNVKNATKKEAWTKTKYPSRESLPVKCRIDNDI